MSARARALRTRPVASGAQRVLSCNPLRDNEKMLLFVAAAALRHGLPPALDR